MTLHFTIPGDPKAKQRPRVTKQGIAFTPKETVSYENLVKFIYSENCGNQKLAGEIRAIIIAYYPIPKSASKKSKILMEEGKLNPTKKPDCDNVAKIILDSLNRIAYDDDSTVTQLFVQKRYSNNPRVDVKLEEITYVSPALVI